MLKNINSDYFNWIILIGSLLLLFEVLFFNGGLIVTFLLSIGSIYLGRKWRPRFLGKVLYWGGWLWFVITVLNMITLRYFLFVLIIYLIVQFYQTQKNPKQIKPVITEPKETDGNGHFIHRKKIFENKIFSSQKSPEYAYEWNDINIQVGVGNTVIDLSDTVLPKGEAVICIRSLVGNVQILIPYEIEVHIYHSLMVGAITIFQEEEQKVVNETVMYETAQYKDADQKIKLFTSAISGKLEVKRV